ncbi:MAG: 3-hydroxyacyl-CoA dehydrogenase NAD-binding domain-containing protein [Gemmataceae bacterium]
MSIFRADTLSLDREADGSIVLTLDVPGRSVNVITRQMLADLDGAVDALEKLSRVPLLVVRSGKRSGFLAGADLQEFTRIHDATGAEALASVGQRLFGRLANLQAPSVAVIHGPCLGGGLELALACDYRLVVDRPGTQLALPEVELGLLPAWGGTQRLPRVVGLEPALQMILTGRRLSASEAYRLGLADALARTEAELREQFPRLVLRAIGQGKAQRRYLPLRTWRQRLIESTAFGRKLLFQGSERLVRQRVPDDMPGPLEALNAIRLGMQRGIEAGLDREREAATRLALSPSCRHLIQLFFLREAARKRAGIDQAREVRRLGVVGAGVMGAAIAQLAALQGVHVVVQEATADTLARGMGRLDELFKTAVTRGKVAADEAARLRDSIRGTTRWEGFAQVDLVIEAAVEDLAVKRNLFRELMVRTPGDTVLATNTSSLQVAQLQEGLASPQRVAALHFFNPVHRMPLVEVAGSSSTSADTLMLLMRFAVTLGKTPVRVGDGPGFVVNRILIPYLEEAVRLVGEGMPVAEVDRVMRRFGMPAGPLELLDQIGLDVAGHVAGLLAGSSGRENPLTAVFGAMLARGWLGQKANEGFYVYRAGMVRPHRAAEELVRVTLGGPGLLMNLPEAARLAETRERLVGRMVNEAAQVLAEGLASEAATIDLAMVLGTGWAPHRGGPLQYADDRGLPEVVRLLDQLAGRAGPRFTPCPELRRRGSLPLPFRS